MRKKYFRLIKYAIGLSVAFIAISNCLNVLSSSTRLAASPADDAKPIPAARLLQHEFSLDARRFQDNGLFKREGENTINTRADLVTRASALSPFAPAITATKSHTPSGNAQPGDTLTYTIVISNSGTSDATGVNFSDTIDPNTTLVANSLIASPIAVDDSYHTIGNVNISVPVGQGVIANDLNPNGSGTLTVTKVNSTAVPNGGSATDATANGSVTMSSDGSFTYTPNVAFRGASDSFSYTLGNGTGKFDTATVTITVNGLIWFVNSSAAPGGDGRLGTPFNCLTGSGCFDPAAADIANDNIFIYSGAYTGGLTLLSGQKFIGQGASQSLLTITGLSTPSGNNLLPATGGANPTIDSPADGIDVGSNNQIWGVTFGNSPGAGINGSNFGTLTVRDTTINNGNGPALSLTVSGTLDAIFQSLSSTNSSTTGITLNTVGGSLTSPTTTVTNPAGRGIEVQNAPAGASLGFGNATVNQSGNTAVFLNGNAGNISFAALNIAPDTNVRALHATENGGSITTTSGAVTTTSAVAVEITRSSGTTPLVISLTSVSSSGSQGGIVLTNTSGSFTVAGDGANARNGTGGSITGAGTTGNGVTLNNVQNVSLSRMNINSNGDFGVKGQVVNGFVLDWCSFTGNGNTSAGLGEGAVFLADTAGLVNGLIGTGPLGTNPTRISNNALSASAGTHIRINNISGTLTELDVTKNTLTGLGSSPPPGQGGSGLQMELRASAVATVVATGNSFTNNFSNGVQAAALGQSNLTFKILGATANGANTFTNNNAGVLLSNKDDAHLTTEVSSNTFLGQPDNAIFVGNGTPPVSNLSNVSAKILSNVITQPVTGINHVVLAFFSGTGAPSSVQVCNNNVTNNGQFDGIHLNTPDAGTSPNFSATVNNNTVINSATAVNAINLNGRQASVACFHVQDNVTTAPSGIGIQVRRANTATVSLEKGVSSSAVASTVLSDNNPLATGSTPTFVSGVVTVVNNGTCSTPGTCSSPSLSSVGPVISSASGQPALQSRATDEADVSDIANILSVFEGEPPSGKEAVRLSPAELHWIVEAAMERWRQAGISAEDLSRLQSLRFEITDLKNRRLATMTSEGVSIDATAAGFGWFFDQTPYDDREFVVPVLERELQTTDSSPAFGQVDLLTVVMRELGLAYLQGKDRVPNRMRPLMQDDLPTGVRRLPMLRSTDRLTSYSGVTGVVTGDTVGSTATQQKTPQFPAVEHAVFHPDTTAAPSFYGRNARRMSYAANARRVMALSPFSGETVTLNIGTISPGESVTIMFQVTVDNPFPNGVCNVTNQGHVTGSNFSQVDTNSDVTPINKALTIGACPSNIATNTDAGLCTAVVTYTPPTADGCPAPTVTCNPASGSAFAKGTTTVTCTASNGVSPDQSCSFTVTVNDTEPPTVTCPSPITSNTDPGVCNAAVTYATPAGQDNCPGVTVNCSPASGSTFSKGVTTVTCTATDAGSLTGNCTFTVTVVDNQAPTIGACPSPITTNTAPGMCSAVVTYATPSASDNCPGVTVGCSPSSGSAFPKGTTTVTCTATDTSSHTASCSFTITVEDHQPPSITCPGNVNTTEDSPGSGCATVTYTTPTPSDNCPGATANCSPASGTCFPIGTTTVTCTAMDTSANTSSCQFTVTVTAIGLTDLSPAKVWIGLKNSDDVGTKFDLLAEVLRNGMVVGSGQLNDVPGGSSGFNNAVLRTITLALSSAVPMGPGDTMSFRLSVRIAATSGHNNGTARLWYNGAAIDSGTSRDAGSRFDATIAGSTSNYFLRSPGFTLDTTAGSSRTFVDKTVSNSGGNPFVAFGTWSKTF